LVQRILSQLRPAISSIVQSEVSKRKCKLIVTHLLATASNKNYSPATVTTSEVVPQKVIVQEEEFSVDLVTDLVGQLRDVIATTVGDVVGSSISASGEQEVDEIVRRLRPSVRSVVYKTVSRRGLAYSQAKIDRLEERIVRNLIPVIQRAIEAHRVQVDRQRIHADQQLRRQVTRPAFVDDVVRDLDADIATEARYVVENIRDAPDSAIISQVVERLRPAIRRVVSRALSLKGVDVDTTAFYASSDYDALVSKIVAKIRVILIETISEIRREQVTTIQKDVLLGEDFVGAVVEDLRPVVEAEVGHEVSVNGGDRDAAVSAVLARIRGQLRRAVSTAARGVGLDLSADFFSSEVYRILSELILQDVRIIVEQEMTVALGRLADMERIVRDITAEVRGDASRIARQEAAQVPPK